MSLERADLRIVPPGEGWALGIEQVDPPLCGQRRGRRDEDEKEDRGAHDATATGNAAVSRLAEVRAPADQVAVIPHRLTRSRPPWIRAVRPIACLGPLSSSALDPVSVRLGTETWVNAPERRVRVLRPPERWLPSLTRMRARIMMPV